MFPLLCLVSGLAVLCGINLYLTVFLTGCALRLGWVDASLNPALAAVGHPAVMIVAGVLVLVEFIMDKIPWVDSFWDAVHTVIRPVGAVGLSLVVAHAAGWSSGVAGAVATGAGLLALAAHLTKSGVRLLINASPEPFSNILASLAEDAVAALLLLWLLQAPVSGGAACGAVLVGTWMVLPRVLSLVRAGAVLLWKKAFGVPAGDLRAALPSALTVVEAGHLTSLGNSAAAAWVVPCFSGKSHGVAGHRAHRRGRLISPADQPGTLLFLSSGWFKRRVLPFSLAGATVRQENTFLSENLVLHRADDGALLTFRFARTEGLLVARLVQDLKARLGQSAPALAMPPLPAAVVFPPAVDAEAAWVPPPMSQ